MNYQPSDIQKNIFQTGGNGIQSGMPFNDFVHDQMKVFDGDRFIVPKQHERFQNLMIPTGLAVDCVREPLQKGGSLLIKELDVNTVNTEMFDSMLGNVCLKKKKNKSEKMKILGKNATRKLFFF